MTRTTATNRGATPTRGADGDTEHAPVIAIIPALGPIPPIALNAGALPALHLRHAASRLLAGTREAWARGRRIEH